jgi:predicted nucleotidyltransferase
VTFLETIATQTRKRDLRFLVIGGLAVNSYGYSRETGDLDILIHRDNKEQWLDLFSGLDYAVYKEGEGFLQLSPPKQSAWPVDLMLVRENTFEPMYSASREVNLYGVQTRIPSLEHLLMLKLHALKNAGLNRFLKDFLDVENLIRINKLDIKAENIKRLFAKYGTAELYEKISTSLANG